ncbi:dipeptide ABC transporter ATP-binding protein [Xylophilus rhododendri]|uniref:Dipeptide ABC transporter ATP-binding protein n=1 Tax=Xylophilus rhododendri TaxID=2697032 RepID=A0A857J433_9BURK|nr:ABC transporter ATP-binding protein [Xylophilus rhododendri]QHI97811.1 dipeptide ABC transporter ATP-binding protein [Xylophilus rhododendri]
MSAAAVLSVDDLCVAYGGGPSPVRVLRDVSLSIRAGEALGLVGESGSGKSTVAAAILGLLGDGGRVESGRIAFKGQDLATLEETQRRSLRGAAVSIVFQDPFTSLNPGMRVGAQIAEPLMLHRGLDRAAADAEVLRLLAEVQMSDPARVARAYPHELSGGMKQRALIAAALACDPALLILDEPTTALDVTVEAQILALLESLRRTRALAILFISHNLAVVSRLCENISVLYAGEVVEQGATASVLAAPRHPYTKGLLAAMPGTVARGERLSTIAGRLPSPGEAGQGCVFRPRCPFATERCATEAQWLMQGAAGPGHLARCWRADSLAGTGWPRDAVPRATAPLATPGEPAAPLIAAHGLVRTFETLGWLESLHLDWRAGGWPLRQRPRHLRAVDDVSLSIAPGEIVGLVGESGSGKTTLGRCMIDLVTPTSGTLRVAGQDLLSARGARRRALLGRAQIVFQNPDSSLNPRKTVRDILARPLVLFGLAQGAALERRVDELLDMVRLGSHYRTRYPHQMSGGEKQRVGIARALATQPEFIVCDEAVSALDVSVQASVLNLLADLRDTLGVAYLFISHDLSVIGHIADRVAVMHRGRIVEQGPAEQVMNAPMHAYTQGLLASIPRIAGARGGLAVSGTMSA